MLCLFELTMFAITFIFIFGCIFDKTVAQDDVWFMTALGKEYRPSKQLQQGLYYMKNNKIDTYEYEESVNLQLYYECHCPDCINFEQTQFKKVLNDLNNYLNIKTYPYGNAKTIETKGKVQFVCQHGPKECYGNKLHACALKHISNHTAALLFNICMMEPNNKTRGSDDEAAARCSSELNINKRPILLCAKGEEGDRLLKYYGEESKQANFKYVPYVLINGSEWQGTDLKHDICAKFLNQPETCQQ